MLIVINNPDRVIVGTTCVAANTGFRIWACNMFVADGVILAVNSTSPIGKMPQYAPGLESVKPLLLQHFNNYTLTEQVLSEVHKQLIPDDAILALRVGDGEVKVWHKFFGNNSFNEIPVDTQWNSVHPGPLPGFHYPYGESKERPDERAVRDALREHLIGELTHAAISKKGPTVYPPVTADSFLIASLLRSSDLPD